jgi:MinD superfamily P-loop ATPase
MKEILILSGKGGTGKTTVAGALAYWLEDKVLVDADVDASNLPLLFSPKVLKEEPFKAGFEAVKDEALCNGCGLCLEKCRFGAISEEFEIDPLACEGCGVCAWFCPEGAIRMEEKEVGKIFYAETDHGPLLYATLYPGEENSGKLVAEVKRKAREWAEKEGFSFILVDGSPGVGCPVIASLSGADEVLLVAEPTVSGLHDLSRVAALIRHFRIPASLIVNKADLYPEVSAKLKEKARAEGFRVLGEIPYDPEVFHSIHTGKPLPAVSQGKAVEALFRIYQKMASSE